MLMRRLPHMRVWTHTGTHKYAHHRERDSEKRNRSMKILRIYSLWLVLVWSSLSLTIYGSDPLQPVLTGPDMAYVGSKVTFQCHAAETNSSLPVTYSIMKNRVIVFKTTSSRPAQFHMKVKVANEGSYYCTVTSGGIATKSNSITLHLIRIRITSEPDPAVLYEDSRLTLSCNATMVSQPIYTWFFNGRMVTPSTSPLLRPAGSKLVVERVTPLHAGVYSCMTESRLKSGNWSSSSKYIEVVVKVYLSQPRITFSITKEPHGYGGTVTCWTSKGTPPATFYLLLDGNQVANTVANESTMAKFPIHLVPGRDMGRVNCLVKTEVQELNSKTLTLVVVPVGGHVNVEVEYLYGADSKIVAAKLHCLPSRGTFPSFQWLLNNSLFSVKILPQPHLKPAMSSYALIDGGRALVISKMDPGESGSYRCRVRDSFDNSSAWLESPAVQVRMIEATWTTIEIITISFCCFVLLILIVVPVCVITRSGDCNRANVSHAATTNSDSLLMTDIPLLRAQRRATSIDDVHN